MADPVPEHLWLDQHWSSVLDALLLAAAPEEGCALVLGRFEGVLLRVETVWPCLNVWEPGWPDLEGETPGIQGPSAALPSRRNRFALDPREQLLAQKWARQRGLQVIGTAHSHPEGPAIPSPIDRRGTLAPTLMLIRGVQPGGEGVLGAWWCPEPPVEPIPLDLVGGGHLGE